MSYQIPSRFNKFPVEADVITRLVETAALSDRRRKDIVAHAAKLVADIRDSGRPGLMEIFLAEYGLSTDEGIALMCLAEALLRVPDPETIDALIEDKIAPSDWGRHLGQSSSSLVNASTWALLLTGRVLDETGLGVTGALRGAIKRLGEPVIRAASKQAMREMGQQFVLGETMEDAMARGAAMEAKGYTYSFDMLGEAATTADDAARYFDAYENAIRAAGASKSSPEISDRPGVSVKLSALHPRYEVAQHKRIMAELVPRVAELCRLAASLNIGLNIDAEEADRLELSLDIIDAVLSDPLLAGWDGFGIVIQAYGLRAAKVIDHVYAMAQRLDRRVMVRLVKGAYWDTEIKRAQVDGLDRFPVFTSKAATDVCFIGCARKLLGMVDRIYPQFATHNAHSVAAIVEMSNGSQEFEFQRLHGMGEQLHEIVRERHGTRCRIYAPVGAHRDLLAYLVRRLLENGANSSFVNQVVDNAIPPEDVVADPFSALGTARAIPTGREIFLPERANSSGWDLTDGNTLARINAAREPFQSHVWTCRPLIAGDEAPSSTSDVINPANPADVVGRTIPADENTLELALAASRVWEASAADRAEILSRAADLYEANAGEVFALLSREAGKTLLDAVGELREAVDFLRFYAHLSIGLSGEPVGIVTCISPWNFPLAIFTGQIAGALSAGCAVLAKPAEQTPLIAHLALGMLHEAGVPRDVLQFLPGDGATVGRALTSDPRVDAVAFTGSTETARVIRSAMAEHLAPGAPLVAETGGINAMIVDSTALLEQAVRDVVASAFQSAGQRCSALRCLYVQEDIAEAFREMLIGAMDELAVGDPWQLSTDVGPLIDADAHESIANYLKSSNICHQTHAPETGHFCPPSLVEVPNIAVVEREIFGPVLHMSTFGAEDLESVIAEINKMGYGLTFGLHTRIDGRVQEIVEQIKVGNIYVNRNQIGAVVGCQPFGGEGLSGTGPKAGGPLYPWRFRKGGNPMAAPVRDMPGPTGETNRLSHSPREPYLCLGPGPEQVDRQIATLEEIGGSGTKADRMDPNDLITVQSISGAIWWGDAKTARAYDKALASRQGAILPLITETPRVLDVIYERHLCVDTTASGGNAALLAETANA
ncbi:MAG: bifunctional proline dehydrogenase/L-glutamate gamma-semialdehyde dehydrogenase PutA [Boseongicola sp.]